ncbi:hypothetical protein KNJ79_18355 [Sphingopyxis indica]|uniref:RES family NAD+ phosphorylase n=1 Tax=Sphingopyxis indica TaxID=436663 RepID=UPI0029392D45|nr:RES domain-containing protein [Sphingopyxis indica]WOF43069.1 hypothetical protein KNJ79_18355 [Sphingopyxis indica]
MKIWRLVREGHEDLDGSGTMKFGGRYSSPGRPIVNFASEAALAVLIALRYLPTSDDAMRVQYFLGWTEIDSEPVRIPDQGDDAVKKSLVDEWAESRRTLFAALSSAVLPEADIILMNPLHSEAMRVPPLTVRPFSFAQCLHRPPMLDHYR